MFQMSQRMTLIACILAGAIAMPAAGADSAEKPQVTTDLGPVIGRSRVDHTEFLAIPYAAPPTGTLRFRPPQPAAHWTTPRDATHFGSRCPQGESPASSGPMSEDCLTLNVYVPEGSAAPRPVLVWIYGGGFQIGAASDYDASAIAVKGGVVVVAMNYRLGPFGFLALDELNKEDPRHVSGNYGLADQQAALGWVKRNIVGFGGDPGNVTIFGESAGGMSVCAHLIAPDSAGLFQRAISQSGFCGWRRSTVAEVAATAGVAFSQAVGCGKGKDTLACLREKPMAALVAANRSSFDFGPNTDGVILPIQAVKAFNSGRFAHVPVIMGGAHDEGSIFVAQEHDLRGKPVTSEQYPTLIETIFGKERAPSILERYPLSKHSSPSQALAAIQTDGGMVCPIQLATRNLSQKTPVYAYEFNQKSVGGIDFAPPVPTLNYGFAHGADVNYLFAGLAPHGGAPGGIALNTAETALSEQFIGYWTRFARSGDPNGQGATRWPRYSSAEDAMLSFDSPIKVQTTARQDHQCAFWDTLAGPEGYEKRRY
jgi:para-nitrobenzyl esterase